MSIAILRLDELVGNAVLLALHLGELAPMKRLTEKTVFLELVTACRLAAWPTSRSPLS